MDQAKAQVYLIFSGNQQLFSVFTSHVIKTKIVTIIE